MLANQRIAWKRQRIQLDLTVVLVSFYCFSFTSVQDLPVMFSFTKYIYLSKKEQQWVDY